MKVAMYYRNDDVRIQEMPVPQIGSDELLVRIMASGICGSDVMEWYRIKKAPRVLGHEITGDIVQIGSHVTGFSIGDRVFVSHHVPCDECQYCMADEHTLCDTLHSTNFYPGGFAEYIRVPAINVKKGTFKLPKDMSYEKGIFIEPLACVVRGMQRAGFTTGKIVCIIGSGISGLLHVKLARAMGAKCIIATDINSFRLKKAREYGANVVAHASEDVPSLIKKASNGFLADLVITCTGAKSAIEQAAASVRPGGTILFFAPTEPAVSISFPLFELWNKAVTMMSTYAGAPKDIKYAIDLIASGCVQVTDMITHRLSLDEIAEGFRLVSQAGDSIKVVIEPHRNKM